MYDCDLISTNIGADVQYPGLTSETAHQNGGEEQAYRKTQIHPQLWQLKGGRSILPASIIVPLLWCPSPLYPWH